MMTDLFGEYGDRHNSPAAESVAWRDRYNQVLASPRWKKLRARLIAKANQTCPGCGWKKETWDKSRTLDLHHKTYERLGNERDGDVEIICSQCHVAADIARAKKTREAAKRKCDEAIEEARFDGWATKVYGEGYEDHSGDKWEAYCNWLDRRGDRNDELG